MNTPTEQMTPEQTIEEMRAETIRLLEERNALREKLNQAKKGSFIGRALNATKNTVGVAGVTLLVTAGVAEAVGFAAAKMTGMDYTFGNAVRAVLKAGAEKSAG